MTAIQLKVVEIQVAGLLLRRRSQRQNNYSVEISVILTKQGW